MPSGTRIKSCTNHQFQVRLRGVKGDKVDQQDHQNLTFEDVWKLGTPSLFMRADKPIYKYMYRLNLPLARKWCLSSIDLHRCIVLWIERIWERNCGIASKRASPMMWRIIVMWSYKSRCFMFLNVFASFWISFAFLRCICYVPNECWRMLNAVTIQVCFTKTILLPLMEAILHRSRYIKPRIHLETGYLFDINLVLDFFQPIKKSTTVPQQFHTTGRQALWSVFKRWSSWNVSSASVPACYAQGGGSPYEARRPEGTTKNTLGKPGLGAGSIFGSTDFEVRSSHF